MNKEIVKDFQLLEILEEDYPIYSDPETFAANFKVCSLVEDTDVMTSNSTAINSTVIHKL